MNFFKTLLFTISLSILSQISAANLHATAYSEEFAEKIARVNERKVAEQRNLAAYVASRAEISEKRAAWGTFMEQQREFLAGVQALPTLDMQLCGEDISLHDLSGANYKLFHHVTTFSSAKLTQIEHYLEEDFDGARGLNLEICPVISCSLSDPYTGVYTLNGDNNGDLFKFHLVFDIDPRAIVEMGNGDVKSPAIGAIGAYLNNRERDGLTRADMANYVSSGSGKYEFSKPNKLLKYTWRNFNEVVIAGNSFVEALPGGRKTRIAGIAFSWHWIDILIASNTQIPDDKIMAIRAIKELAARHNLPLMYFAPQKLTILEGILRGKCNLITHEPEMKTLIRDLSRVAFPRTFRTDTISTINELAKLNSWLLVKWGEENGREAFEAFKAKAITARKAAQAVDVRTEDALLTYNTICRTFLADHIDLYRQMLDYFWMKSAEGEDYRDNIDQTEYEIEEFEKKIDETSLIYY